MTLTERELVVGDARVPYHYGHDCTDALAGVVADGLDGVDAALVVIDRRVAGHAERLLPALAAHLRVETLLVDAAEPAKTLTTVESILEYATARKLTRRSAVLAMGGGTVGNIAGLAAALLYRGTRLVHLPTTPVAAFDAVVSVKQGVNLSAGKNLCGTYYAPALIACDLGWLATVPRGGLLTGLAELVKNVLVAAPALEPRFTDAVAALDTDPPYALHRLLGIGIDAKEPYLARDPHERGAAVVFEYGHTAGHAVEFTSAGAVGHGEAVAWGMLVAAEVSRRLRGLDDASVAAHRRLTALLGLPDPRVRFRGLDRAAVRAALLADNKRGHGACGPDEVLMVLLDGVGRPATGEARRPLVRVPVDAVMTALDAVLELEVVAG